MPPLLVNDQHQLDACCNPIAGANWITVDTEFMRERTYYPQLCLVQIGVEGDAWCIDALADIDLDRLLDLLCNNTAARVLHAARQDLEIFFHLHGAFNSPLFDTQVAAGLLGMDAQIGYAGLIKNLFGKELEKGFQRADWSRRPLPDKQIEYALDDVRYLADAYPVLQEKLQRLGRLDWAIEDSQRLLSPRLYLCQPDEAYQRIGQLRTLPAAEQHVLRRLAAWRERLAQQSNTPRNWIGNDNTLVYVAKIKPDSTAQLRKVKGIDPALLEQESDNILEAIDSGLGGPDATLMSHPEPLTDEEQKLYKRMKQELDKLAKSMGIQAPVLGTRKDVEMLLRGNPDSNLLHGWRKQVVGDTLGNLR